MTAKPAGTASGRPSSVGAACSRPRKLLTKARAAEVIDRLARCYPDARCALDHGSVFELLVSVVLSAQTTDVSVNKVTPALFAAWPDAAALAGADPAAVQEVIRTIGMYRQKASNIVRLSQKLLEDFGGEVPQDFDLLQTLPGVGRKSANVVLSVGFGEERLAVDTHVFRVANRIGLCDEPTPEKTELALVKRLPEGRLSESHHYLIWHGRRVCHARKPACDACVLPDLCRSFGRL
ncbi:MAG: endonuclease III [Clostridiales Family XIII bacterium]|jgi:endonuclease-3|nr:endonuclease III [Clostridiales Family XIII bacterium]